MVYVSSGKEVKSFDVRLVHDQVSSLRVCFGVFVIVAC